MTKIPPYSETVLDSGIDYLTATAKGSKAFNYFADNAARLIESEAERGNERREYLRDGFSGFQCGGIAAGGRVDEMLVRLSGRLAQDEWRTFAERASNVSRLDLQVTVKPNHPGVNVAEKVEAEVLAYKKARNRKHEVQLVRNDIKGPTLYTGARISDRFSRTYCYGLAHKQPDAVDHWRYELEAKRGWASSYTSDLLKSRDATNFVVDNVRMFFARRGALRKWSSVYDPSYRGRHLGRTDVERVRAWLRTGVSGRVRWLIERGQLAQLLEDLGLTEYVKIKRTVRDGGNKHDRS